MGDYKNILVSALVVLLASCDTAPSTDPVATDTSAVIRQAATEGKAASCPSQDFDAFFKAFSEDVNVQKSFTVKPLQSEFIDVTAEPEPQPVSQMLNEADLNFPLIPNLQKQAADRLKQTRTDLAKEEVEVTLTKEDTDYQMSFFFKKDDCWMLYRMRDDSL